VTRLVTISPAYYGTQRFITVFTRVATGPYPEDTNSFSCWDNVHIQYDGVSNKSFQTEWITKYTLTTINTRWETVRRIMTAKLTRLTHKIAIQLHLVAESCAICRSRSRQPVRKLLDTPSYDAMSDVKQHCTQMSSGGTAPAVLIGWGTRMGWAATLFPTTYRTVLAHC
jgi:hypothetical protein